MASGVKKALTFEFTVIGLGCVSKAFSPSRPSLAFDRFVSDKNTDFKDLKFIALND